MLIFAAEGLDLIQYVLKGSIFRVCPDNDTKAVVLVFAQLFFIIIPQAFRQFGRYADSCVPVSQNSISSGKTDIAGDIASIPICSEEGGGRGVAFGFVRCDMGLAGGGRSQAGEVSIEGKLCSFDGGQLRG